MDNEVKIKVTRVVIYEGQRSVVEDHLSRLSVPLNGQKKFGVGNGEIIIKSTMIGNFPEIIDRDEQP